MAGIYAADIYCDDCVRDIRDKIAHELWADRENAECPDGTPVLVFDDYQDLYDHLCFMDERYYDSGEFPKHCDDDEESDCPQHCGSGEDCLNCSETSDGERYGHFFGNNLTNEGEEYVRDAVNEDLVAGITVSPAVELWKPCYDYIDYVEQCANCGSYTELDDDGGCEYCINSPEDGDFTITPCGGKSALGRVGGKFIGKFDSDDDALAEANRIMSAEKFWPNVWIVSDHGNWELLVGLGNNS